MKVSTSTNLCGRAEDIVTYLYGEATLDEAKDFEKHMQNCSSCSSELVTFGEVREAVGEWRQQALGSLTTPAFEADAAQHVALAVAPVQRRSALAALQEFLTLSPAWMRAATAVAAIAFCALAVIAVAYFTRKPQTVIVQTPGKPGYSDKEVEAKIAEALKKQNESQGKDAPISSTERAQIANNDQPKAPTLIKRNASGAPQLASNNSRRRTAPRIAARPSEMELASKDFLPFTAPTEEEKLPTLADLVDDDN
ncbi:MAG: hypothetical protein QOJ52_4121 [Acidimicrobiaceae bacterium]|jgi:hypothetical protein|nr:hypothetical protein [Acidimicrobiaceae bacterium]